MAKKVKTNALRILDRNKVKYDAMCVEVKEGTISGEFIAKEFGKDPMLVHKTLVTRGSSKELYVFVVPVSSELDLKKAADAAVEKKIEMLPHKDLQKFTGYLKGGCSPIGMKKLYKTFINSSASENETIIVNGGKIGLLIELSVAELVNVISADLKDIKKIEETTNYTQNSVNY